MPVEGRQITVLLVDPDPYVSRVIDAGLSKDGVFRVTAVARARDALVAAMNTGFDVILWEMRLKETSETLPGVRALCGEAALILMTTDDRFHISSDLSPLGIAGILVKPFGLDALTSYIERALVDTPLSGARKCLDVACAGQQIVLYSEAGKCVTRVFDVALDTFTVIGPPRVSTPSDFAQGTPVRVEVQGEDALYSFRSRLARLVTRPVPCWELRMPTTIHRHQRRKYPRKSLQLPARLQYRPARPGKHEAMDVAAFIGHACHDGLEAQGTTENLSLGGCALVSPEPITPGTDVLLIIEGPADMALQEAGKVCRCVPIHQDVGVHQHDAYRLAVQFRAPDRQARRQLRQLLELEL